MQFIVVGGGAAIAHGSARLVSVAGSAGSSLQAESEGWEQHTCRLRSALEKFRRRDSGHLTIEITVDDPKAYLKPITYTLPLTLIADEDLLEYFCSDNEKDVPHYK